MEHTFEQFANAVALALECIAILLIGWGAARATIGVVRLTPADVQDVRRPARGRAVVLILGRYLLLGLEFTLAADVVRTAIAPTWNDIGKLAAIAGIRTFLNYFLERDLEHARAAEPESAPAPASPSSAVHT